MPPGIAAVVFTLGILGLFWLDRDRNIRTSGALWVAVAWLALSGSRSVWQWVHAEEAAAAVESPEQYVMEGNPVDRVVYASLVALGLIVLLRRRQVGRFLLANVPIVIFFLYCAASLFWSDYPDVAFKRWTKALGDFVMVLVVLTDRDRLGAIKRLLTRVGFLLVPLSILFIKYYPALGRTYSRWEGATSYIGVATTKNALGMISLLFGLGSLWRLLTALPIRSAARTRHLIAHGIIVVLAVWLCWVANSMTSLWCLILGGVVLLATAFRPPAKSMVSVHLLIAAVVLVPFLTLFLGVGADLAHSATGRNISTLTDRTDIWKATLSLGGNAVFGTGFESFWLGSRLTAIWSLYWWHPNEAHNGYLEVFLNLGWAGIAMLVIVIATGYRTVIGRVRRNVPEGTFLLALFAVGIVYNFTEAALFKMMTPIWIMLLLAITKVPRRDMTGFKDFRDY